MTLTDKQIDELINTIYEYMDNGICPRVFVRDWLNDLVDKSTKQATSPTELPAFLKQQAE
jgi:hypothetical protein